MPTLEELLNDATITDDLEINFGDKGKFKVGDLRSTRKAVKDRETKLASEEKAAKDRLDAAMLDLKKKQDHVSELADQAAKLMEGLKGDQDNKGNTGDIDWDGDPIYGPVGKRLKGVDEKLNAFNAAVEKLSKDFQDSAKFVLMDYYERRWNSQPEESRKGKNWKDYLKIASEKKFLNDSGLPDPVEALNRELEPLRIDEGQKKIKELEDQIKTLQASAGTPRMPRPGASGNKVVGADGKVFDSVDSLVDAAFADPMIQEIAGGGRAA